MNRIRRMKNCKTPGKMKSFRKDRVSSQSPFLQLHILSTQRERLIKEKIRWEGRLKEITDSLQEIDKEIQELRPKVEMRVRESIITTTKDRGREDDVTCLEY